VARDQPTRIPDQLSESIIIIIIIIVIITKIIMIYMTIIARFPLIQHPTISGSEPLSSEFGTIETVRAGFRP